MHINTSKSLGVNPPFNKAEIELYHKKVYLASLQYISFFY